MVCPYKLTVFLVTAIFAAAVGLTATGAATSPLHKVSALRVVRVAVVVTYHQTCSSSHTRCEPCLGLLILLQESKEDIADADRPWWDPRRLRGTPFWRGGYYFLLALLAVLHLEYFTGGYMCRQLFGSAPALSV